MEASASANIHLNLGKAVFTVEENTRMVLTLTLRGDTGYAHVNAFVTLEQLTQLQRTLSSFLREQGITADSNRR